MIQPEKVEYQQPKHRDAKQNCISCRLNFVHRIAIFLSAPGLATLDGFIEHNS
jgi:hypothetical protein